jgi:hypothetical protein
VFMHVRLAVLAALAAAACQGEQPDVSGPIDTADRLVKGGSDQKLSYSITARLSPQGDSIVLTTDYPEDGDNRYLFVSLDPPAKAAPLPIRGGTVALGLRAVYASALRQTLVMATAGLFWARNERPPPTGQAVASGDQMMAIINLDSLGNPQRLWIAAATYASSANGRLLLQDPVGNGDGNIDADEFIQVDLPQN